MLRPDELGVGDLNEPAFTDATAAGIDAETAPSPGVKIHRLYAERRQGRETWWAELSPDAETYEPRCGCCPLLISHAGDLIEYGDNPLLREDLDR